MIPFISSLAPQQPLDIDNDDISPQIPFTASERMLSMTSIPSFRQTLLGGKALNRFSTFVTSGAEAYVLHGAGTALSDAHASAEASSSVVHGQVHESSEDEDEGGGAINGHRNSAPDVHFVDAGPSWQDKIPLFRVLVHSPAKRTSALSGAYIVYSVTSFFESPTPASGSASESGDASDENEEPSLTPPAPTHVTVFRRYSHFVALHTALARRLPGITLPPLPEKHYAGRFNDDFVEARRGDLERYLARVVRHPVARYAEALTLFLSCEDEKVCRLCSVRIELLLNVHGGVAGAEARIAPTLRVAPRWPFVLRECLPPSIQSRC